ncbi:MAG TPA: hypothetical protein VGO43_09620 [Pyrinomonadaceae bacterium]|jgi:hypothetical protein|nr:hypothetical protein [Pyrinomonadaceae bacterium]
MRTFKFIFFAALTLAGLGCTFAQSLDISSGGAPTITGAIGGSVTGSSSVLNNLAVTINFGQVGPINTSTRVKVTVPIAVRSSGPYKVTVTYSGSTNANVQAVQKSDIGFGMNNWHAMGSNSRVCTQSSHIIYSPFNNDPTSLVTLSSAGRAQYVSDLADVTTATTILSGPRLSNGGASRATDDGYIFDAIFVITPQFYAASTTTANLVFTISTGPTAPC